MEHRTMKKNGKIDFLKFVFAIVIVVFHAGTQVLTMEVPPFVGGSLAVEFFFIVSGYLLMASISRMPARTLPLGVETKNFMIRKLKGFYPEVALAFVMGFALELHFSGKEIQLLWEQTFQSAFLLNMTGISLKTINAQIWYISSMLLCMMVLFPLIRKYQDMMVNVVLPLVALLILGSFCINKTSPRTPRGLWMGYTYKGNFRAMAELSIGICLYPLAERLKKVNFSNVGRILLSVVEWACYISFLEYMWGEAGSRRDYYYLLVCAVAILLSFSQQGIDTAWFQNRFCSFLGKISFPLFLAHNCWAKYLNNFLPEGFSNKKRFVIYLAVSAVATVLIMAVSALVRKLGKALKKPVQKLLFTKEEQPIT